MKRVSTMKFTKSKMTASKTPSHCFKATEAYRRFSRGAGATGALCSLVYAGGARIRSDAMLGTKAMAIAAKW